MCYPLSLSHSLLLFTFIPPTSVDQRSLGSELTVQIMPEVIIIGTLCFMYHSEIQLIRNAGGGFSGVAMAIRASLP